MIKIQNLLKREREKLVSLNYNQKWFDVVRDSVIEIWNYIKDILDWKVNKNELKKNFLTPTLIFLWKISRLHEIIKSNKIKQVVIDIDFNAIDYKEFNEYFAFKECESWDWIELISWSTTSIYNKYHISENFSEVFLLLQEAYEHEDDTDDSRYYIILKWY